MSDCPTFTDQQPLDIWPSNCLLRKKVSLLVSHAKGASGHGHVKTAARERSTDLTHSQTIRRTFSHIISKIQTDNKVTPFHPPHEVTQITSRRRATAPPPSIPPPFKLPNLIHANN